MEGVGGEIEE
jgi:hypothetical protein